MPSFKRTRRQKRRNEKQFAEIMAAVRRADEAQKNLERDAVAAAADALGWPKRKRAERSEGK